MGSAQAWLEVNGERVGDTVTVAPGTVVDVCFSLHADKNEEFLLYAIPYWYPYWDAFGSQTKTVDLQAGQSKVAKFSIKMNNTAKIKAIVQCAVINEATGIPGDFIPILTKWFKVTVSVKERPPVSTTEGNIVCTTVEYTVQGENVLFAAYFWNKGDKRGSKVFDITINGEEYGKIGVTLGADATGTEYFTIPLSEVRGKKVCVGTACTVVEGGGESQPSKPGKPSVPSQPTQPTQPSQPTKPTQPSQPSQPTQPTQPSQPTKPTQPNQPTQPVYPTQPMYPTQPPEQEILLPLLGGIGVGVLIALLLSKK